MDENIRKQITEYVYKNYKLFKNKDLIIKEYDKVYKNERFFYLMYIYIRKNIIRIL